MLINTGNFPRPPNYGDFQKHINLYGLTSLIPASSRKAFKLLILKRCILYFSLIKQ